MGPIGKALSVVLGLVVFAFFSRFALRLLLRGPRVPKPLPPPDTLDPRLAEDAQWLERAGFKRRAALQLKRVTSHVFVTDNPPTAAVLHAMPGPGNFTDLTFFSRCGDGLMIATSSVDPEAGTSEPRGRQQTWRAHGQALESAAARHGPAAALSDPADVGLMLTEWSKGQDLPELTRNISLGALVLSGAGTLGMAGPFLPGIGAGHLIAWGLVGAGSAFALFNLRDVIVHWWPWLKSIHISDRTDDARPGVAVTRAELERLGFAPFGLHVEVRHGTRDEMPTFRHEGARTWANICLPPGTVPFGYFLTHFAGGAIALTWSAPGQRVEGAQYCVDCGDGWDAAFVQHQENCARLSGTHGVPLEVKTLAQREAATRCYYRVTADLRGRRLTSWPWLVARIGFALVAVGGLILAVS